MQAEDTYELKNVKRCYLLILKFINDWNSDDRLDWRLIRSQAVVFVITVINVKSKGD